MLALKGPASGISVVLASSEPRGHVPSVCGCRGCPRCHQARGSCSHTNRRGSAGAGLLHQELEARPLGHGDLRGSPAPTLAWPDGRVEMSGPPLPTAGLPPPPGASQSAWPLGSGRAGSQQGPVCCIPCWVMRGGSGVPVYTRSSGSLGTRIQKWIVVCVPCVWAEKRSPACEHCRNSVPSPSPCFWDRDGQEEGHRGSWRVSAGGRPLGWVILRGCVHSSCLCPQPYSPVPWATAAASISASSLRQPSSAASVAPSSSSRRTGSAVSVSVLPALG